MTLDEAAGLLKQAYNSAPRDRKVCAVQLFGIRYAEELKASGLTASIIALRALGKDLGPQIRAGINLADYVELKHPGGTP